jgi:hypothetical protein
MALTPEKKAELDRKTQELLALAPKRPEAKPPAKVEARRAVRVPDDDPNAGARVEGVVRVDTVIDRKWAAGPFAEVVTVRTDLVEQWIEDEKRRRAVERAQMRAIDYDPFARKW